jgi:hypothetical protein
MYQVIVGILVKGCQKFVIVICKEGNETAFQSPHFVADQEEDDTGLSKRQWRVEDHLWIYWDKS